MRFHLIFDRITGELNARGKSGRLYSDKEIALANKRGDNSVLDDLDMGESFSLADVMHDCPECRAAPAHGERPAVLSAEALEAALDEALRAGVPWRRRHRGRR